MTNEELAQAIQAGDASLLTPLWEQAEKLIRLLANKFYNKWKSRCLSMCVTQDDLYQQGYFALLAAVKYFDVEKGYKFLTYLNKNCQTYFYEALEMRSDNWRKKPMPISLDTPLSDEADYSLADTIPDPEAEKVFETVVENDYIFKLRYDLTAAMTDLSEKQRQVIDGLYFQGLPYKEIGVSSIDRLHMGALSKLSKHPRLKEYRAEIIRERYGRGYGFRTFKELGMSPQEQVILELEKRGLL